MEIHISKVRLAEALGIEYLDQIDYATAVCPICRSDDDSFLLADVRCDGLTSLETAYCSRCEHRYLRKLPSPAWLGHYYATAWDSGQTGPSGPLAQVKGAIKRLPFTAKAWRLMREVVSKPDSREIQFFPFLLGVSESARNYYLADPDVKKILEVGCGYGATLDVFRRKKFNVLGTETSARRAQESRKLGLTVLECSDDSFEDVAPFGPFDLAYSAHVLEHIADPDTHMENLSKVIRDDGYLSIEVPHLMYDVNVLYRSHSPVHCHGYSPRSLALLLSRHGFVIIRMSIDNNIRILSRKSATTEASFVHLPAYGNTANLDKLPDPLAGLSSEEGQLKLIWDHAYLTVDRVDDGRTIYRRPVHFNIEPQTTNNELEFRVQKAGDGSQFPFHFCHQGQAPPIWIKKL